MIDNITYEDAKAKMDEWYPDINPDFMMFLYTHGYFIYPASLKYHGNYPGGLFDHSTKVAEVLHQLTVDNGLKWEYVDSPLIIGLFHDICKLDDYVLDPNDPTKFIWNENSLKISHGSKSIAMLKTFIDLTEEEMDCIKYHMGAYTEKDKWKYYNDAIKRHPNVLWTHNADVISSIIYGV